MLLFTLSQAYGPRQANLCLRAFRHEKKLTAHAQPFRRARDLAFCMKVPLDPLLVSASSGGSGETAQDCADAQARLNLRCSHRR